MEQRISADTMAPPAGNTVAVALPPLTRGERLDALCARFAATYERKVAADGRVILRLILANEDAISGIGASTEEALSALERRIESLLAGGLL